MSATEDDTELRDLLVQNLENSGVLNKLKAEMRAAVFLAMEEQDRLENKNPLINENLKKCLNSRDGRLVAGLIVDFLQVFNLDFSLAVFQPETNSLSGLDGRDQVCRDLGLSEVNRNVPLLLELLRRRRPTEEPTQKQISLARKKFDFYDKDGNGSVGREDLKNVFTDLFPSLNQNMLERFITDELRAADQSFSSTVDFHVFVGFYTRLFSQCRAVVVQDGVDPDEKIRSSSIRKDRSPSVSPDRACVDLDLEVEEDPEDGDSFFDDPLPKPQKTYGRKVEVSGARGSPAGALSEGGGGAGAGAGGAAAAGGGGGAGGAAAAAAGAGGGAGGAAAAAAGAGAGGAAAAAAGGGGAGAGGAAAAAGGAGAGAAAAAAGGSSASEQSHSRKGAPASREKGFRDPKAPSDKPSDDDVEYDDDFNSHRSDLSRSEFSIGEEIEEVSIEGPDTSDKDSTQDLSVSQLSRSHGADYMEEVS